MNQTNTDPTLEARQQRFTALLEPLHGRLLRFARANTRQSESARDLASEAILAAWRNFDTIRDEQALLSYLFTTVSRLAARERERSKRHAEFDAEEHEHRSGGVSPDLAAEVALLHEALWKLPEEMREAVTLFEVAGFSIDEIARMQNAGISAVKMRISRGRERLKELLGIHEHAEQEAQSTKGVRP